ncbi:MAG: FAD-dependent oxidoreductase [Candidatus Nanopelagicales bacterium]
MSTRHFVIVGAGLAGAKTAEHLRALGYDGRISLIGNEHVRPYERPPLTKDYLLGKAEAEKAFVHPQSWYADNDVDLLLDATVESLGGNTVALSNGTELTFDRLAITTGARPRRLDLPGSDMPGIHYLRTMDDAQRVRDLFTMDNLAIVGAGWIGLEVAAAARASGVQVTVLETAELPLLRVLGPRIATVFADLHRDHGVHMEFGISIDGFEVEGVRLADGRLIPAQAVVVGVGVVPNTELAEGAGLAVDNGILADEHLRTSHPDIFAAGDVVNATHPVLGRRIRVEHWANALNQPAVVAAGMLDQDATYDRLPYFFTDQYDLGMEYVGHADATSEVIVRGDESAREFVAFWLSEGRVQAGMNVNVWDVPIRELILSQRVVDPTRLADPDIPLAEV